jgi:hypothetical protein
VRTSFATFGAETTTARAASRIRTPEMVCPRTTRRARASRGLFAGGPLPLRSY